MTAIDLRTRLAEVCREALPLPGKGHTAERHLRLFGIAEEDVSLAKLAEAHFDALAILAEAGREPEPDCMYAVWASDNLGRPLTVQDQHLSGEKAFCSGFGLVDRALVTLGPSDGRLIDVDVRPGKAVQAGKAAWYPEAFRATNTGSVLFCETPVSSSAIIGDPGFYLNRPGFWHGACGPAACWAGGAAGLLRFAEASRRRDPHTLAHLAAIHANVWATRAILTQAGHEIDMAPHSQTPAQQRALTVRHLIEQHASDTLVRFGRAYGAYPLAMDGKASRRYQEVEIFLRQCHAERDLEALAGTFASSHHSLR